MSRTRFQRTAFLLGILAAACATAQTEAPHTARLVFRDRVEAHWFADSQGQTNLFWYRVEIGKDREEFVLVNAEQGTRRPAFDQERVAEALTKLLGHEIHPEHLPIESLDFSRDGHSVTLHGTENDWRLDLATYTLSVATNSNPGGWQLPNQGEPHPSRRTGPETEITFLNSLRMPVDLFWVDPEGKRVGYGTLQPGERRMLHTFAGHVWVATEPGGGVVAVFEAEEQKGVAVIRRGSAGTGSRRGQRSRRRNDSATGISPDGRWQVLVRGDNLFVRDLKSGKETQLTYDANPNSTYARDQEFQQGVDMHYDAQEQKAPVPEVYWSPDSKRLVAMRLQPGTERRVYEVESSPLDQLQPKLTSFPYLKPGDQVPISKPHLFDMVELKEIPISDTLFANPWSITDVRWAQNSSRFTFLFNQRGHQVLRVLAVDAQTGAVKPIVEETSKTFIDYSGKFYCDYLDSTGEILWMSERDGWNHLYLYDAETGKLKNQVTRGDWVVRGVDFVDEKKRQIWFKAGGIVPGQDPYFIHVCRVNFDGMGFKVLTEGNGTHTVRFAPDRRFFIDTWSRVDLPPVTQLRRSEDGQLVCALEKADATALYATGWRPPEPFVAKGRDGLTDIYGVIWRPRDFSPSKKYPVLENIYAGPQDSFTPKEFHAFYREQELADDGFIVVQMDGMGTSNRSKKFHDVCWKNLRDAGFPDRIAWIKAAAAKYPWMDLSRAGIYGTSAGGQDALRGMLDHGDFYRAGVADSGCYDNRMDKIWWNEQWLGWPVDESYARSSCVVDAFKLQGKLLLMAGELDKNVDPSSTLQVVHVLIQANKDFDLLYMPGAGHGIARTPYGWRRLQEFFEANLLGAAAGELVHQASAKP